MKLNLFLSSEDVRCYCIHNRFYTAGDSDDYNRMLCYVDRCIGSDGLTFEELRAIAYDIVVHSSSYDDCFELSDPDFLRCTVKSVMLDLLHLSSCVFFDDDVLPPADQII